MRDETLNLEVGNYYGCLTIKIENGLFYWSIENWNGFNWVEIPEYLYDSLRQHACGQSLTQFKKILDNCGFGKSTSETPKCLQCRSFNKKHKKCKTHGFKCFGDDFCTDWGG